MTTIYTFMALD